MGRLGLIVIAVIVAAATFVVLTLAGRRRYLALALVAFFSGIALSAILVAREWLSDQPVPVEASPAAPIGGGGGSSGLSPWRIAQELEDEITTGAIAADIPAEMAEGEARRISVEVVRTIVTDVDHAISTLNTKYGRPVAERLRVAPVMYVDLFSEDGAFEVRRFAPVEREQPVPPDGSARWLFTIKALAAGEHRLTVIAGVSVQILNHDQAIVWAPYERRVAIKVSFGFRLSEFWQSHKAALVSALIGALLAVVGYFAKRWWEGKKNKSTGNSASSNSDIY
jgi:hypothetical protein